MYCEHFNLQELPFNNTPDPRFFFPTPDHEEALASLIYAVTQSKGFVLLTGEVGTGKTLVSRILTRKFGDSISFASINNSYLSANDLLDAVCHEFDLPVSPEAGNVRLARALEEYLLEQFAQDRPVALILDEGQNLSDEAFEQLRMIGNLEADDAKLLQIVILGQPELRDRFRSPGLRQLRQRIFRSYHLPALTQNQCEGYIEHRMKVAGHPDGHVFDESAVNAIFDFSGGLPRLINSACDNALLSAYSADRTSIDAEFVQSVIEQMLGLEQQARQIEEQPPQAQHRLQKSAVAVDTAQPSPVDQRESTAQAAAPIEPPAPSIAAPLAATPKPLLDRRPATDGQSEPASPPQREMDRIERLADLVRGLTLDAERAAAVLQETCAPPASAGLPSLSPADAGNAASDVVSHGPALAPPPNAMSPPPMVPDPVDAIPSHGPTSPASPKSRFAKQHTSLSRLLDESRETLRELHRIASQSAEQRDEISDDPPSSQPASPSTAIATLAQDAARMAAILSDNE